MFYQKTIREPVTVEGIGLHTGKPTRMTFKPAPANTGVFLVRKDIAGSPALKVQSSNVKATQMATVVGGDLFAVYTVEHCMSAVAAFRIDNIFIELEGPELPICDGSASAYFQALKQVGIQEQAELREYLYITQPIYYAQGEKYAYALPYNGFKMTSTIEFPHPKIGRQKFEIEITAHSFETELSTARTFGFLRDVEAMRAKGLALGGSLDNAVVLDESSVINPSGLRFPDEFVRHKTMDALGDLLMLGSPLMGHVVLHKAGHDVMHGFVEKILSTPESFRMIQLTEPIHQNNESLYARPRVG